MTDRLAERLVEAFGEALLFLAVHKARVALQRQDEGSGMTLAELLGPSGKGKEER